MSKDELIILAEVERLLTLIWENEGHEDLFYMRLAGRSRELVRDLIKEGANQ